MNTYEKYRNDSEINKILDSINIINKGITGCHGRYHAMFVVDTVEHILKSLSYDSRTIELSKIAALMHDIGNIAGRNNHARKSAMLASVFLDDPAHLSSDEKNMLIQAIEDHSSGTNIQSVAGAALLIGDKVDISYKRVQVSESIDSWHKNLLEIKDVNICVSDKVIQINYVTTEAFCQETLTSEYKKGFNLPIKAAKYLGCACNFLFNGEEFV